VSNRTFVLYDDSGQIKQSGLADPDVQQLGELSLLVCDLPEDITKYKVSGGSLVLKTTEELAAEELPMVWKRLRKSRDKALAASDWTQVPDAPVDQAAWATYRQALRDLPANTEDPANPVWPIQPS
jgi:hypothetical protein